MELDEARLATRFAVPRLEEKLDRITREVVVRFKGGTLSQDIVAQLRGEWLATSRLLHEFEMLGGDVNG